MIVLWQIDYWIFSLKNWYKNYLTICENKKLNVRWILKFTSVYLALVTREEFSHWSETYDHPSIHFHSSNSGLGDAQVFPGCHSTLCTACQSNTVRQTECPCSPSTPTENLWLLINPAHACLWTLRTSMVERTFECFFRFTPVTG